MPSVCELRDEVIRLKNEEGLSFAQIGQKLGFTKQRAHQLFKSPAPDPATTNGASRRSSRGTSSVKSKPSNGLTVRQRRFAAELSAGRNQRQAAIEAGVPPGGADAFAQRTLNNNQFRNAFNDLLERIGLTEEKIARVHLENLEAEKVVAVGRSVQGTITEIRTAPDYATRQKAVADAWRLYRRIGSNDGEGNDASPIQINLTLETIRKVECLTGRRIVPVDFQPVEDEHEGSSVPEGSADDSTPAGDPNSAQADSGAWGDF